MIHVRTNENAIGTKPPRRRAGHGGAETKLPCLMAGGTHHPALRRGRPIAAWRAAALSTPTTNNRPTPLPGSRKRSARRERMVQNECLCYGIGDHRKRMGEKPLPTGQSDHETNTRHRIAVLVDKLPGLAVCRNQAAQTQQAFVTFLVFYSQSHHCGHRTARTSREVAGFYRSRSWAVTPPNPGSTKPSRPQCPTLRRGSPAAVAAETGPRQSPTRAR